MMIVKLKKDKEIAIRYGHPWIFSGAIDSVKESSDNEDNAVCRVIDSEGRFVCQAFFNPFSRISARVLSLGREPVNAAFFEERLKSAMELRKKVLSSETNCFRLANGEADGLPGLVADVYDQVIVVQFLSLGMEKWRDNIISSLKKICKGHAIYERSDSKTRGKEGLDMQSGILSGSLGDGLVRVKENGINFAVDIKTGDRTGFYIDRKTIRSKILRMVSGKDVLDLFSYTGSFSLYAITGNAKSVVSVDSSALAHAIQKQNMEINKVKPFVWRHHKDEVVRYLSQEKKLFDLVVLDPPPFANEYDEFLKINRMAMERLKPGGFLVSISSYTTKILDSDLLKIITRAGSQVERKVRIVDALCQSPDHPWLPSHPEGVHLNGFIAHLE